MSDITITSNSVLVKALKKRCRYVCKYVFIYFKFYLYKGYVASNLEIVKCIILFIINFI